MTRSRMSMRALGGKWIVERALKWNCYICKDCGVTIYSRDLDEGVTPFIKMCTRCKGDAYSQSYRLPHDFTIGNVPKDAPLIEWYRPSKLRVMFMHRWTREHIRRGGLACKVVRS